LKDDTVLVAIKKIKLKQSKSSMVQFLKDIKNEIEVLKTCDSP